jgi:NADPH:quinone reductase-like Zn-dependent oxidoreductase
VVSDAKYDWILFRPDCRALEDIAALVDAKVVKPIVDEARFTLDQIAEVHEYYESGKAKGKVMIDNAE